MNSRIVYSPRGRRKKRKFSGRFVFPFLCLVACGLVIAGMVYLLRLPRWQVSNVSIQGLERLSPDTIRTQIEKYIQGSSLLVLPRSSYFLLSKEKVEENLLAEFPRLASVVVTKEFPSKMTVEAHERGFWAIYCISGDSHCGFIDKTGYVYEGAPESTSLLIRRVERDRGTITIPSQALEASFVERLDLFAEKLKAEVGEEATLFLISEGLDDEFRIRTRSGYYLYLKRDDEPENVMKILKTFLEKEIGYKRDSLEYIDLRFGNKVFYK